ncbi:MAG: GNAT family N-acetyltransferase [Chitinophagales bacterium]
MTTYSDKVMSFVYECANELKTSRIELIVNRQNKEAIDFYEKRGFRIIQPIVSKFEDGHLTEEFKMEKNINRDGQNACYHCFVLSGYQATRRPTSVMLFSFFPPDETQRNS